MNPCQSEPKPEPEPKPAKGSYAQYCPPESKGGFDATALDFQPIASAGDLARGSANLEGAICYQGTLYMSHIGYPSNIVYLNQDNKLEYFQKGIGTNGLTLDASGNVWGAAHGGASTGRVVHLAFGTEGVTRETPLVTTYEGKPFNSPNDLVVGEDGVLYFTDPSWLAPRPNPQPKERAYYVDNGNIFTFGSIVRRPNGIMLSGDNNWLYMGGSNGLFKFPLDSSGYVIDMPEKIHGGGVDGLSRDCDGNIYAANSGKLTITSPEGEKLAEHRIGSITNVAFCGDYVYATTQGNNARLYRSLSAVKGMPF